MALPSKWIWPGTFIAAVLSFLALWTLADRIEADVSTRTAQAISGIGVSWADVAIDGRDLTLLGSAHTESVSAGADATSRAVYGVRVVDNRSGLVAERSPYTFTAKLASSPDGRRLDLKGFMPDEAERAVLVEQATSIFSKAIIMDSLIYAPGAPDNFFATSTFALTQLAALNEGVATISDADLSITGIAASEESFNAVVSSLAAGMPEGSVLALQDILPPPAQPYIWSAEKTATALVLDCYVPDEAVRTETRQAIEATSPGLSVTDNRRLASGQPDNFDTVVLYSISHLSDVSSGTLTVSGIDPTLTDRATDSDSFAKLLRIASESPQAKLVDTNFNITPPVAEPYVRSIERTDTGITLKGSAPCRNDAQQTREAVATRFPDAVLTDSTVIADGTPDDFRAYKSYALDMLAPLATGKIALTNDSLDVEGQAESVASYSTATGILAGGKPNALEISRQAIEPVQVSPYIWSVARNGAGVAIAGYVASADSRATLREAIEAAIPSIEVDDTTSIAMGAPEDIEQARDATIAALSRLNSGQVAISDRSVSVSGEAIDSAAFSTVADTLRAQLPGSFALERTNIMPPPNEGDYTVTAIKDGAGVRLSGMVPDTIMRRQVLETVATSGSAARDDDLQFAAGAPDGFAGAVTYAIGALESLDRGTAWVSETSISVLGKARSVSAYETLQDQFASNVPAGFRIAMQTIRPASVSPYSCTVSIAGDAAILSGFVPDEAARRSTVAAATSVLSKAVEDKQQIASGAPAAFSNTTDGALAAIAQLERSEASLSGTTLTVRDHADSEDSAKAIVAILKISLTGGDVTLHSFITFPEPVVEPAPVVPEPVVPVPVVSVEKEQERPVQPVEPSGTSDEPIGLVTEIVAEPVVEVVPNTPPDRVQSSPINGTGIRKGMHL